MRGSIKSFRMCLREAFEDALDRVKQKEESVALFGGDAEIQPQPLSPMSQPDEAEGVTIKLGLKLDKTEIEPSNNDVGIEDESASRERQQASGYLGAFDGAPEYGDDMVADQGGNDIEMDDVETDDDEPEDVEVEDDDEDEDDEEEEEEEVEEGVSQSKRSNHGYNSEDPTDYHDLPGEGRGKLGEGLDLDEADAPEHNQMLNMFKSLLQSLNPQQKQAFKTELPRMMASSGKPAVSQPSQPSMSKPGQSSTSQKPMPKMGQLGKDISNDPLNKLKK